MLKTASDFENSINFLMSGMSDKMNSGLKYQIKALDSESFNSTLDLIETRLNKFYEKTRVLEDVIKYTKEYLEQTIYSTAEECRSILNSIEENRDKLKTNAFISYSVPMLEDNGSYTDRDNTQLPHCSINNNTITLSGQMTTIAPIKLIERKKGFTPYKSSLDNLMKAGVYRTFYLLDGQVNEGLKEDIYIELTTPSVINFLDIIPSNCTIQNIRYINESDGVEYGNDLRNIVTRERKIKAIQLTLVSTLYKTSKYYIDQSRMDKDFWDKVKDNEYKTAMGITNIVDLDHLAGIDSFRQAYKKYLNNMESWISHRTAVAEANRSNGYSDSVPYIERIMTTTELNGTGPINRSPFNADPYPIAEQNIRYKDGGI